MCVQAFLALGIYGEGLSFWKKKSSGHSSSPFEHRRSFGLGTKTEVKGVFGQREREALCPALWMGFGSCILYLLS